MELPLYLSRKVVQAARISDILKRGDSDVTVLYLDLPETTPPLKLAPSEMQDKPVPEAGWYYVQYEDGYFSFSPPKEFEQSFYLAGAGWTPHHGKIGWSFASKLVYGLLLAGAVMASAGKMAFDRWR